MGILDKIKALLSGPSGGATSQVDQAKQSFEDKTKVIDDATGGQFDQRIDEGVQSAEGSLGAAGGSGAADAASGATDAGPSATGEDAPPR